MWQSEEISKVCLNVVQNGFEGSIRELLYHRHAGKEQSRGVNNYRWINYEIFNEEKLTVKLQQTQSSKHRGRVQDVSSARLRYIFAGNTAKTHLNLLELNINVLQNHLKSLNMCSSSPEQVERLQAAH